MEPFHYNALELFAYGKTTTHKSAECLNTVHILYGKQKSKINSHYLIGNTLALTFSYCCDSCLFLSRWSGTKTFSSLYKFQCTKVSEKKRTQKYSPQCNIWPIFLLRNDFTTSRWTKTNDIHSKRRKQKWAFMHSKVVNCWILIRFMHKTTVICSSQSHNIVILL